MLHFILADDLNDKRDNLRKKIRDFQPARDEDSGFLKVNIALFGQMGAGKSTFLNTLYYALTG